MNEETKNEIVSVKFEITKQKFKKDENGQRVPDGDEKRIYHYVKKWYDKSELDYGEYWNCGDGSCYPYAEDGGSVHDDFCQLCEWSECAKKFNLDDAMKKLRNPGDFVEYVDESNLNGNTTLRVTAMEERPRLDAKKFDCCDMGYEAMHCVRVYGKPLVEDGIISDLNRLWRLDTGDLILSLVREKCGVPTAEINWQDVDKPIAVEKNGIAYIFLSVVADSIKDVEAIFRNFGVHEEKYSAPIKAEYISGNEKSGERRVHANICVSTLAIG